MLEFSGDMANLSREASAAAVEDVKSFDFQDVKKQIWEMSARKNCPQQPAATGRGCISWDPNLTNSSVCDAKDVPVGPYVGEEKTSLNVVDTLQQLADVFLRKVDDEVVRYTGCVEELLCSTLASCPLLQSSGQSTFRNDDNLLESCQVDMMAEGNVQSDDFIKSQLVLQMFGLVSSISSSLAQAVMSDPSTK